MSQEPSARRAAPLIAVLMVVVLILIVPSVFLATDENPQFILSRLPKLATDKDCAWDVKDWFAWRCHLREEPVSYKVTRLLRAFDGLEMRYGRETFIGYPPSYMRERLDVDY